MALHTLLFRKHRAKLCHRAEIWHSNNGLSKPLSNSWVLHTCGGVSGNGGTAAIIAEGELRSAGALLLISI